MSTHIRASLRQLQESEVPLSCDLQRRAKGTWSFVGKVALYSSVGVFWGFPF